MNCKLCRLCGVEKNKGLDLFEPDSIRNGLLSKVMSQFPKEVIHIDASDNLTKFICHDCELTIDHFVEFCEMVKKTQETLNANLSSSFTQLKVGKSHQGNSPKDVIVSVGHNNNIRCEMCLQVLEFTQWMTHWHVAAALRIGSVLCSCQECGHIDQVNNFIKEHSVLCPSCFFATCDKLVLSTESGKQNHVCETCKKSFRTLGHKNRHKMIHEGLKPFLCDTCGVGFNQRVSLKKHLLTHTNSYPHHCEWCGQSFRHKVSLQSHVINVHAPISKTLNYECDQCKKVFVTNHKLTRHYRSHTKEQPYKCTVCCKSFSQTGNLKTHLKKHKTTTEFSDIDTANQLLDSPTQKMLGAIFDSNNDKGFMPLRSDMQTTQSIHFNKNDSTLRKETLQDVFSDFDPHNCSIYTNIR